MRSFLFFLAFCIVCVVGVDVEIDNEHGVNFSKQFICVYKSTSGVASVRFGGGMYAQTDSAHPAKKLSLFGDPTGTRTGQINTAFRYTHELTTTGPNWVYLYDITSGQNVDYVQIEVVAHGYTGDCELAATDPPTGWATSYPPS